MDLNKMKKNELKEVLAKIINVCDTERRQDLEFVGHSVQYILRNEKLLKKRVSTDKYI